MESIDLLRALRRIFPNFSPWKIKGINLSNSYTWFWTSWCGYRGAGCANNGVPIMDSIVRATRYDWSVIVLLANRRAMHGNRKKSTRLLFDSMIWTEISPPTTSGMARFLRTPNGSVPQVKTTVGGKAGPKDYHPSQQMNRRELFLIHNFATPVWFHRQHYYMPDPSSFRCSFPHGFPPLFSFLWKCQLTLGIPPSKKTMLG